MIANPNVDDRCNLEWLVWHCLQEEIITMSRGRELLRFQYMDEMRDWYNDCYKKYNG